MALPAWEFMAIGASGGIGHMAVQLAKRMGARVLAIASGQDGVALAKRLGADKVIDGYSEDIAAAAREFAPKGIDAVLLTAGGAGPKSASGGCREAPLSGLSLRCSNTQPNIWINFWQFVNPESTHSPERRHRILSVSS